MSDYQVTTENMTALQNKLDLPKFQRGYVWNDKKKVELINSLHEGFPFGALLTYQKSPKEKEKLLDGQQRWSTILDFNQNKASYFKKLEPVEYEKSFKKLNEKFTDNGLYAISKDEFDKVLSNEVDLSDWVDDQVEGQNPSISPKEIRNIFKKYQENIQNYLRVEQLQIPIIRYTGDEKNIAQVFENLNKGGVQLSKFEIFAAAWTHQTFKLQQTDLQNKILENVKRFYLEKQEKAEDYGFALDGFSEDELTSSREINLFELGVGIGLLAQEKLSALVADGEKSVNEIGFGILGLAVGLDPKKLGEMPDFKNEIVANIENTLNQTNNICTRLASIFDKLIRQNTAKDNHGLKYHRALSTTFKSLSYFAALWDLDENSEEWRNTVKNIPGYYVRDAINEVWGNAGDSRLFEYYPGKRRERSYVNPINIEDFKTSFHSWIDNENTATERFTPIVKALATIHANYTYLSDFVDFGEPLQFEHIYPKARVRELDTSKDVMLGKLGNTMYLPKALNQNKKIDTLYEVEHPEKYEQVIKESMYPTKNDFENAFSALKEKNFGIINSLIKDRSYKVADSIVDKLLNVKF